MASVRIPDEQRTLTDQDEVTRYLATLGIDYERWADAERVPQRRARRGSARRVRAGDRAAQGRGRLRHRRRHRRHRPDAQPRRDAGQVQDRALARRGRGALHRRGRGLFHVHPKEGGPVIAIEVEAGDLIRVPRGTWHWFDLCGDRDIRAIRLFQDKSGWTPHYTEQRRRPGLPAALHGSRVHPAPGCVDAEAGRRRPAGHRGHDDAHRVRPPDAVRLRARPGERFLERHWNDPEVRADVARLEAEHAAELRPAPPPWRDDTAAVVAYVHWLMDRDRKSTGLKSLQGKIWEEGYRAGDLKGEVYPDVPPALERWRRQGIDIAIFSSGSVQAQRSLFSEHDRRRSDALHPRLFRHHHRAEDRARELCPDRGGPRALAL